MAKKTKKFLIIDGNALVHRAFHALPPLKTKKGQMVNAVYGFCLVFLKALKEMKPAFVAATFDLPGPTFRHKKFKEYKAKRPKAPEELYQQIAGVKEVLRGFGVPIFEKEGFEADDLIATIAAAAPKKQVCPGLEIIILSGDLDNLQLVNAQTKVYTIRKGIKDTVLYDVEGVKERYGGLTPVQLLDFKALRGDPSDNIPGVTGIGEKTAIQLLKEFGSLENLYSALISGKEISAINQRVRALLEQYKEQAFLSKELARMRQDVPIDFNLKNCEFGKYNKEKLAQVFKSFEFYTLLSRLSTSGTGASGQKEIPKQAAFNLTAAVRRLKMEQTEEKMIEEIEQLYQQGILSRKIAEIERALVPVVREMEQNGIKIALKELSKLSKRLGEEITKLQKNIYKLAGQEFNLNSPQQLAEVLFSKLKVSPDGIKTTPGGAISTGAGELKKLKDAHPIVNLILKYRGLFKLKSGFIDPLPRMLSPKDGRLHPHFHQLGTETGRMSCSSPNLQNIPIKGELGREIRKCFVPEEGYDFLSADYSQMELRIAASVAEDKKMLSFFKGEKDIHKMTAAEVFKIPEEKITQSQRELAKTLNYGVLYGLGAYGFSERTGISFKEAKEFIEKYFENFEGIAEYVKKSIVRAKEKGFSETLFGRKRFLPEINSIDARLRSQAERMARNFPIQGSTADIIKMAMVEIDKAGLLNSECRMLLQIHDELLFEVRKAMAESTALAIKKIMEGIVKLKAPLKVYLSQGENWGELETF